MAIQRDQKGPTHSRVLLILNERTPRDAIDCYRALDRLESDGAVEAWSVYPYLARYSAGVAGEAMIAEIEQEISVLNVTVLLFAHFHDVGVGAPSLARLRALHPDMVVGFWEGDGYEPYRKPFPRGTLGNCVRCDVVFVCGDGYIVSLLKRHGCTDVRYVPSTGDDRFVAQPVRSTYEFDVAMIGSRMSSKLPFKRMPGSSMRRQLAARFTSRFGSRFAVFGSGWTGPSAHGPVPYAGQAEVYGRSAAVLGCNNLYAKYSFSDRLPIALQSGRPLIHEFVEGAQEVFGVDSGVRWFRSIEEALHLTEEILNNPEQALVQAERARLLAEDRFTTYDALGYMIRALNSKRRSCGGAGEIVDNPWIGRTNL